MTLRPLRFYGQEDEDEKDSEFPDRDRRPRSTGQLVVKRSRRIKDAEFPGRRRPRPRPVGRKVVKKTRTSTRIEPGTGKFLATFIWNEGNKAKEGTGP